MNWIVKRFIKYHHSNLSKKDRKLRPPISSLFMFLIAHCTKSQVFFRWRDFLNALIKFPWFKCKTYSLPHNSLEIQLSINVKKRNTSILKMSIIFVLVEPLPLSTQSGYRLIPFHAGHITATLTPSRHQLSPNTSLITLS